MARNLNAAVRPVVVDALRSTSRMDFRSNEADRTVSWESNRVRQSLFDSRAVIFRFSLNATDRGRRSFVTHHENRNAHSRLFRRAKALPRRLYDGFANQP